MLSKRLFSSHRFRLLLSVLIVGHLCAVFLPPLAFQTRGPLGQSPSVASLIRPLESYEQFLYIDRGYAFFAPDPGPSHLIQVAISSPGEGESGFREVMIPDRNDQWPRLLYHRHFMLTEFLYEIYQPPLPAELADLPGDEAEEWRGARSRYEHFRQSMVEHLRHKHADSEVAIRRIEHLIPDMLEYREQPVSLTDLNSYRVLLDEPVDLPAVGSEIVPGDESGTDQLPEAVPIPSGASTLREASKAESLRSLDPSGKTEPPSVGDPSVGDPSVGDQGGQP